MELVRWVGGILIAVLAGGVLKARVEAGRSRKLQAVGSATGYTWDKKDRDLEHGLEKLACFARFHGDVRNVFRKPTDLGEFAVFEYRFRRNKVERRYPYAALRPKGRLLPVFSLRNERILEFSRDIDFDGAPGFSKAYFLRGEDESAIRVLFGAELIAHLEAAASNPWIVESNGRLLALRRASVGSIKPEDLFGFADEAYALMQLLVK